MGARLRVFAPLGLVAVLAGSLAGCEADPISSTLDRLADPVVVTGAQAAGLQGTAPNRVVAFSASSSGWRQIPVQVDERLDTTMAQVYGLPATQRFYGSSINVPVNVYADPNTFTGPDTNPNLDADDEIAVMARDAGGQVGDDVDAPDGTTGGGVEVKVDDPTDPDATGYVYLFASEGSLDPSAGEQYVDYEFNLTSGDYKATYKRTDGPNPEDSTLRAGTYSAHFADRWLMDELNILYGDRPTADILDRIKYDIPLFCARNENTFDEEEGAFVVNRSGPVRAIRSVVGSNSGPNTQNTQIFYDAAIESVQSLRVHAIPLVGSHIDLSREAVGMTFRNPQVPNGVTVDGQPDTVPAATPSWWTITGAQGGLGVASVVETDATQPPTSFYEDDFTPTNTQCTGDSEAVGDVGGYLRSAIACTDPGLGCTAYSTTRTRIVVTPRQFDAAAVRAFAEDYLAPLTVSVSPR